MTGELKIMTNKSNEVEAIPIEFINKKLEHYKKREKYHNNNDMPGVNDAEISRETLEYLVKDWKEESHKMEKKLTREQVINILDYNMAMLTCDMSISRDPENQDVPPDYYGKDAEDLYYACEYCLKLLTGKKPEEKITYDINGYPETKGMFQLISPFTSSYNMGWNDCLKAISGE